MKLSKEEQEILSKTAAQAEINQSLQILAEASNFEGVCAAHWANLKPSYKAFLLYLAKMDENRAKEPISKFTAAERRTLQRQIAEIDKLNHIASRALKGGTQPDKFAPDMSAVIENRINKNLH